MTFFHKIYIKKFKKLSFSLNTGIAAEIEIILKFNELGNNDMEFY